MCIFIIWIVCNDLWATLWFLTAILLLSSLSHADCNLQFKPFSNVHFAFRRDSVCISSAHFIYLNNTFALALNNLMLSVFLLASISTIQFLVNYRRIQIEWILVPFRLLTKHCVNCYAVIFWMQTLDFPSFLFVIIGQSPLSSSNPSLVCSCFCSKRTY